MGRTHPNGEAQSDSELRDEAKSTTKMVLAGLSLLLIIMFVVTVKIL